MARREDKFTKEELKLMKEKTREQQAQKKYQDESVAAAEKRYALAQKEKEE